LRNIAIPCLSYWNQARLRESRPGANSKRQQGSRRPIESVGGQTRETIAVNFEPLASAESNSRGRQNDRDHSDHEGVKGTALAGDTVARQAVIDCTARAVMAVMMIFTGMPVLVGGVINRMVRGSDSNACIGMHLF
jgi:hypothetical protein